MYTPQTKGTKDYTESIDEFRGLDLNERISSGFLAWTRNCSSRRYPTVSARLERGYVEDGTITAMCALDGVLYYIKEGTLYSHRPNVENDSVIFHNVADEYDLCTLVTMGTYVLVFPTGYYYNTKMPTDSGWISQPLDTTGTISYTITNSQADGLNATLASVAPVSPNDGDYWIDTSGSTDILKRWSATYQEWTQIPTTFICLHNTGIGMNFKEMDSVLITGSGIIEDGHYSIYHRGNNYIVIPYLLDKCTSENNSLSLTYDVPYMDFVVEQGNRLWGCRYGEQLSMTEPPTVIGTINEIYACALGDFKNWNRFMGLSTDSYVASRGCDGPWTGAVSYLDTVVFFKENHIEVVHPSNTGAHQIETYHINGTGVAPGSARSVVVVDNVVYYHGLSGFYAYTGNLPRKISYQLGEHLYYDAVAGDLEGRYYVSVSESNDDFHLFVYDAERNLWYREDDTKAACFCRIGNELYFATSYRDDEQRLYCVRGTEGTKEPVTWVAVTHDFAYSHIENKNAKRVYVRANVTAGRKMKVYISYDSSYVWEEIGEIVGDGVHKYVDFPIVPARCDHYRLKFECDGDGCIWSVVTRFDDHD